MRALVASPWMDHDFIGPRSSQKVDFGQLLQAGEGVQSLKTLGQAVTKVELQTGQGLMSVEGPARRQ